MCGVGVEQDESVAPATVDGMLGGFGHTSHDELTESAGLLASLQAARPELKFGVAVGTLLTCFRHGVCVSRWHRGAPFV